MDLAIKIVIFDF